jgi:hypothetical protein
LGPKALKDDIERSEGRENVCRAIEDREDVSSHPENKSNSEAERAVLLGNADGGPVV